VLVGAESAARFIDPALVERRGSQPGPVYRLFAGPSLPHLDGTDHLERKSIVMQAFTPEALAAYLPSMQLLVQVHLAEWAMRGEVGAVAATKILALQAVAQDIMGITRNQELQQLENSYSAVARGFTSPPLPFFGGYARGLKAVEAVLRYFEGIVSQHRQTPTQDGLSRMLAGGGDSLTDNQLAREMHHIVLAGRVIYAHLLTILYVLDQRIDIRAKLEQEIGDSQELSLQRLDDMPFLQNFVLEVKRTSPVVPGMFGKARTTFEFAGHTVPQGWQILFGLRQSLFDDHIFPNPETFLAERFAPPRCEHQKHTHAFVPHGPGQPLTSHHCAGTDYATLLAKVFVVTLLGEYRLELPPRGLITSGPN